MANMKTKLVPLDRAHSDLSFIALYVCWNICIVSVNKDYGNNNYAMCMSMLKALGNEIGTFPTKVLLTNRCSSPSSFTWHLTRLLGGHLVTFPTLQRKKSLEFSRFFYSKRWEMK